MSRDLDEKKTSRYRGKIAREAEGYKEPHGRVLSRHIKPCRTSAALVESTGLVSHNIRVESQEPMYSAFQQQSMQFVSARAWGIDLAYKETLTHDPSMSYPCKSIFLTGSRLHPRAQTENATRLGHAWLSYTYSDAFVGLIAL